MAVLPGSRYIGRSVFPYYDPLTEEDAQLLDRFIYVGALPMNGAIVHTIIEGEQLDFLAWKYLKNPRWWWIIALYNPVLRTTDDMFWPLDPEPGTSLLIPSYSTFASEVYPLLVTGRES